MHAIEVADGDGGAANLGRRFSKWRKTRMGD
jgi:hypothetical protein